MHIISYKIKGIWTLYGDVLCNEKQLSKIEASLDLYHHLASKCASYYEVVGDSLPYNKY